MVVLGEQVNHGGVEIGEGVGGKGRGDVVEEGDGLAERDAAAEREEAAEEVEREMRRRRGREQVGDSGREGRERVERRGYRELGGRVGAAVVEERRMQGVQELGVVAGQGRGRGFRVRLGRRARCALAEMAQKDNAAGGREVVLGLEEESHGVAVAGDGAAAWRGTGGGAVADEVGKLLVGFWVWDFCASCSIVLGL